MRNPIYLPLLCIVALQGCTAIDMTRLKANTTGATSACLAVTGVDQQPPPGAAPGGLGTTYGPLLLPGALKTITPPPGAAAAKMDFAGYVAVSQQVLQALPPKLRNDDVTKAFFQYVITASAEAQLRGAAVAAAPGGAAARGDWLNQVQSYPLPSKLTWGQLKNFTDAVFDYQFRPALAGSSGSNNPPGGGATAGTFESYFRAYYEGKFVDRFGKSVQKPQLPNLASLASGTPVSLTITDAEISAAETVLLEYLIDLIDPTPVLGDANDAASVSTSTNFYPGGTPQSKPTIVGTNLYHYMKIPDTGCGVTTKNIDVLTDVAQAAGDRAAAIGGLSFNSLGGVGFSLGFLGKVSIGDNQTLSTMAKQAVSRFAMRVAYASGFWLLRNVSPPPGAAPASPPPGFLNF